ncbi:MAG: hypothetical protein A2Y75_08490 [Candidatus Solincola sediminis]|uniref:Uncharacterized protein n=1 Tax=Candidatus Solincola sediminis TaxID=1797199 RepID=A0A1F2WUG3_9ACTN|nr:MAG: hypothetical protein A2Y75_08490 [Candidatus Solincola sediminis]
MIEVRQGSSCEGLVEPGDLLLEIDRRPPQDILDCLQASEPVKLSLRIDRNGIEIALRVCKQSGEPLGLVFDEAVFDGTRTCRNKCFFCFVDQMPQGLRATLYIKDDDYRLSFYYGNFITLNNLSPDDIARILRLRLSPLYVSLHTTDPELRDRMMGGDGAAGLNALQSILDAGIEVHLQVVSCPGINDGDQLRRILEDVLVHYAGAASLGIVPVGITSACSNDLIRAHDKESSCRLLELVEEYQEEALRRRGDRLFFAADEFYINAGREFPAAEDYEDFPQLENGIGMARKFIDDAHEYFERAGPVGGTCSGIITGVAGEPVIRRALPAATVEKTEILTVKNGLFGARVTATSLLSGGDIISAIRLTRPSAREMLFPETLLREGRFLDDLTPEDVRRETGINLTAVEVNGAELFRTLSKPKGLD